jgi:hypothetical protein
VTTVPAAELHRMFEQVVPHMSDDDTLPVINSVQLEARDGYLFATATDRYTMAVARTPLTSADTWRDIFIPAESIPALTAWLKPAFDTVTIAILHEEDDATVQFTSKTSSITIERSRQPYKGMPDWRKVFHRYIDAEPQVVPLTGFTTKYLARWQKAAKTVQCWQYGATGALVVMDELGYFLGMQMPVRHEITRDDLLSKWRGSLARIAYVDGVAYSLEHPWADAQGDPWEYAGRDSQTLDKEPLMRLVGIDDDPHTLTRVIEEYGPLTPIQ